jgi:hypothetical protein
MIGLLALLGFIALNAGGIVAHGWITHDSFKDWWRS